MEWKKLKLMLAIIGFALWDVFVNIDGSCALKWFNVAFELLSLNNVDEHKWGVLFE